MRQWKDSDLSPFAKINSDKDVMEFFPGTLSQAESNEMASKIKRLINERGWGFWALELTNQQKFIGFVGLHIPEIDLPFNPCVEIGWRLDKEFWGKGYASEAAEKSLEYAFSELELPELVAFTSVKNMPSQKVMRRIGMADTGNNFNHLGIDFNHPLSEHVLYKISSQQWLKNTRS